MLSVGSLTLERVITGSRNSLLPLLLASVLSLPLLLPLLALLLSLPTSPLLCN
jgi:hypothetical protein